MGVTVSLALSGVYGSSDVRVSLMIAAVWVGLWVGLWVGSWLGVYGCAWPSRWQKEHSFSWDILLIIELYAD